MANGTIERAAELVEMDELLSQPEPQPSRLPGPADIPQVLHHPLVVAALRRKAEMVSQLATVEGELADIGTRLGAGSGMTERQLRAKLLVAGKSDAEVTEAVARRRELKDKAAVLAEAVNLAEADVQAARQDAIRELTPQVRQAVYLPAALAYLAYLAAADRVRDIVMASQAAGLGYDLQAVGGDRVPADARDRYQLRGTLGGLIGRGLVTRAEVESFFPGMFEGYAPGREAG